MGNDIEQLSEEELRRVCLEVSARGETVTHILSEYLHVNDPRSTFDREHREADRAAAHRSEGEAQEWWIASGAAPPAGRHRIAS